MRQQPASRESNMKRALDIVRIGHDTLDEEHEDLQNACLEIIKFQSLASDMTVKKPVVFQYELKNQSMIEPHIQTLITATASFEPVINNSSGKDRLDFSLAVANPSKPKEPNFINCIA